MSWFIIGMPECNDDDDVGILFLFLLFSINRTVDRTGFKD